MKPEFCAISLNPYYIQMVETKLVEIVSRTPLFQEQPYSHRDGWSLPGKVGRACHPLQSGMLSSAVLFGALLFAPSLEVSAANLDVTTSDVTVSSDVESVDDIFIDNGYTLLVENGGVVGASGSAKIGINGEGILRVTGSGSVLRSPAISYHILGEQAGSSGTLLIEEGGYAQLYDIKGGNGSYNIRVSGSGSTLYANYLEVGDLVRDSSAMMVVDNGGTVSSQALRINAIRGGSLLVTGEGSSVEGRFGLFLGSGGIEGEPVTSSMMIADGGSVTTQELFIGKTTNAGGEVRASSGVATVTVSDTNSRLNVKDSMHVGGNGSAILQIEDGGNASIGSSAYFGGIGDVNGFVTGENSTLDVSENLSLGHENGSSGQLQVANGGKVSASTAFIGNEGSWTTVVTGTNSTLDLDHQLYLGFGYDSVGTLAIEDGGAVNVLADTVIGQQGHGKVTVTGDNSRLDVGTDLHLSYISSGYGALRVEDGGAVSVGVDAFIGNGGSVDVTGVGSTFAVGTDLYLGDATGAGALLNILSGGEVSTGGDVFLGLEGGDLALVEGAGSLLEVGGSLFAGVEYGSRGRLVILQAGTVVVEYDANLGLSGEALAFVNGEGSVLDVKHALNIGNPLFNTQPTLSIGFGGTVSSGMETVIGTTGNGTVTVSGVNSKLDTALELTLGYAKGSSGTLLIENGGAVTTGRFPFIGYGGEGSVAISGEGSSLEANGTVFLGHRDDSMGTLLIADGGKLFSKDGVIIGHKGTGSATLSGIGSSLEVANSLMLGHEVNGSGILRIEDGADVSIGDSSIDDPTADVAIIGRTGTGRVLVTGIDSALDVSKTLSLGHLGGEGTLSVEDGGSVTTRDSAYIGNVGNGAVEVTGAESMLHMDASLYLGREANAIGTLDIKEGGTVTPQVNALIGYDGTGEANISGVNSKLDVGGVMILGRHDGSSGKLMIGDGGTASANGEVIIGDAGIGDLIVTGTGSNFESHSVVRIGDDATSVATVLVEQDALLKASRLVAGSGSVSLTVDGATIQAGTNNASFLSGFSGSEFTVGSHGMELDTNGYNIGIKGDIDWSSGGALTSTGMGTLTLHSGQVISGGTTVKGSKLIVGGGASETGVTLQSDVHIASDGVLGGSGKVLGNVINERGTIAPGNSIGTTTILGSYSGTGTLEIEVEGHTTPSLAKADQLVVANEIDVSGTTLALVMTPTNPAEWAMVPTGPFIIVNNLGSSAVTGTFNDVQDVNHLLFLDETLDYNAGDGNDISLTLTRNDLTFTFEGSSVNQRAVGESLDSMDWSNPVYNAVVMSTGSMQEALASYNSLSGEINASVRSQLIDDSHFIRSAVSNRLHNVASGYGHYFGLNTSTEQQTGLSLWSQAFGSWGQIDGDGNTAKLDRSLGGLFFGIDALAVGDTRVGLVGGYSASDMDVDVHHSSIVSDNYHLGIYIGSGSEGVRVRGGIAASWHQMDGERYVSLGSGGFTDNVNSTQDTMTLQAFGEVGYNLNASGIPFEPFLGLAWVNLESNSFTEKGGHAALTARDQSEEMLFSTLGLQSASTFLIGETDVTLQGKIGWQHASDDTTTFTQAFAAGGDRFTIEGVPVAQDLVFLEAGFAALLSERTSLMLNYSGQISSESENHGLNARVKFRF
ncbi:autotransporter domain-containing protein [Microbulbifer sp. SSSA007]|uniref:autotransporter domain-containing protein n=1 Tax=Microbulbifer sp. SSSA007 TaxID=3243379 RepID=UPI004039C7CF